LKGSTILPGREMFRLARKGPVQYLESTVLKDFGFLTHAFLTRNGGVSQGCFSSLNFSLKVGDLPESVQRNLKIVEASFMVPEFFLMSQVHGDRVLLLKEKEATGAEESPQADAVITAERGIAIGIKTADCVPILLCDPVRKVIGAAHAGWRSTAAGIAPKTASAFVSHFSSKISDLIAVIGPCIGPCCYEVDRVVYEAMSKPDRDAGFKTKSADKWMLDPAEVNRSQLIAAGLDPSHVFSADICTACRSDLFFSHRKEGSATGRQFNFIMLG